MKKYLRFTTFALVILALLLSTFPASAGATTIPLTGECILIAFPPWLGDLEQSPDYRYWYKPDGMEHWRNQVILFTCDFNEDRLDGYFFAYDNWNINPNDQSHFGSRSFGSKGYYSDALGNDLGLWEARGVGYTDQEGNFDSDLLYKGRGIYQGLLAKTTWSFFGFTLEGLLIYKIEGDLLVPGN